MYVLLERFIIGATPAWRALLAAFASTPFFLVVIGSCAAGLWDDDVRATLNLAAMWSCVAVFAVATVLNVGAILWLWPRRNRPDRVPGATLMVIQVIGLSFSAMAIYMGVLTTGVLLVLMGMLAIGLWLFEQRAMLVGYLSVNAVLVGHDLGVLLQWWPYAPAFTPLTFAEGPASWWFTFVRESVFVVGWTSMVLLLWVLIGSLESITEQLARLSNTDALTGLANRRSFMEVLGSEIERQSRTWQPLCVVLIDADHFKRVNDTHGHAEGDKVLVAVARLMMSCTRGPTDLACRLGGEEFALILPDTRCEQAVAVCMRLREKLAATEFGTPGQPFNVTLSMGVVEAGGQTLETVFKLADEQLYRAKLAGRDRICVPDLEEAPA